MKDTDKQRCHLKVFLIFNVYLYVLNLFFASVQTWKRRKINI